MVFNRPRPEPVSTRQMDRHFYDGYNTICQVLRDIYHMTDDEKIRMELRVAMAMAKKMEDHIREHSDAIQET